MNLYGRGVTAFRFFDFLYIIGYDLNISFIYIFYALFQLFSSRI